MTEVIAFPLKSYWCFFCGKQLTGPICIYTCTINGHLGSMVYCEPCIEKAKEKQCEG